MTTRRDMLKSGIASTATLLCGPSHPASAPAGTWGSGLEGQRKADLGNGLFRNPILAGDYPDPTILKDGEHWYMTHSSFDAAPGLLIWTSMDLVNWSPVAPALEKPLGTVV